MASPEHLQNIVKSEMFTEVNEPGGEGLGLGPPGGPPLLKQVSGFRFPVSSFQFQVSGFRFVVLVMVLVNRYSTGTVPVQYRYCTGTSTSTIALIQPFTIPAGRIPISFYNDFLAR